MWLLSLLSHQSFLYDYNNGHGKDKEEVDEDAHDSEAKVVSLRVVEIQGCSCLFQLEDN